MKAHIKTRHSKRRFYIAGVLALIGIVVLSYPGVRQWIYKNDVATFKQDFLEANSNRQSSQNEALYKYLKAENERLYKTGQRDLVDAFSYETPGVDLSRYGIKDNCIGFVAIPKIKIEIPIYLGANDANLNKGAAHLTETSYPIGGNNTNSVIAAHRGYILNMFRHIDQLQPGDEIIITNFREQLKYRVTQTIVIYPNEIERIKIQKGRDLVTLIACTPLGSNAQRIVVYCERVEN